MLRVIARMLSAKSNFGLNPMISYLMTFFPPKKFPFPKRKKVGLEFEKGGVVITSMTGFGRAELKTSQGHIRAEIKTTNHKFFEVSSRLPNHLMEFEETIRKIVAQE